MEEGRSAFKILTGKPTGKIPLWRPRRRWEDNICVFLRIPENVTVRDTFSYMHSMLSIDFIDPITSKIVTIVMCYYVYAYGV